ncbi:MAG: efflux RND transporter periplasmic adaptor subunit [Bacteroidetes bacterium]|nr:efflux RND transporter periplasmic adaptor subunit [Bacteroidota bacterium]
MKKVLLYLGLTLVVLAISFGVYTLTQGAKDGGGFSFSFGNRNALEVRTENVKLRDITETVTASGKLFAKTEVTITPEISGEIVQLWVEDGDSVIAGQLLVEIDPEIFASDVQRTQAALSGTKAALASAKAALLAAEANLKNASANYDRIKMLREEGVESQANFEVAQARYETAKSDIAIAQESVKSAGYTVQSNEQTLRQMQEQLSRTKLRAPVSGIVSGLSVKVGETVLGTSMMSGTPLMKIVDLNLMEVHVDVSESDVLRIRPGDTAFVEVDAYLDRRFSGIVTQVATAATSGQFSAAEQATNYKVEIVLDRSSYADLLEKKEGQKTASYALYPGMSGTAEIKTRVVNKALSVPIQSVTTREDTLAAKGEQIREVVFVFKDNLAIQKEVKSGIQDDDYIQILSGLSEAEEVIIGPYGAVSRELQDSLAVKLEKAGGKKKKK